MVIRYRRLTYHRKVRAQVKGSGPDRERASAMDLDQAMDQARMEIWGLAISRPVMAVRVDRWAAAVPMMVVAGLVSAAAALFKERIFYLNRNRSTPRTRAGIRSRERLC